MATVKLSKKYTLQVSDFVRGALLAVGTSVLTVIQQSLEKGELKFNWTLIGTTAISTFVAYLIKNGIIEPPKVVTTLATNTKAENAKENIKEATANQ